MSWARCCGRCSGLVRPMRDDQDSVSKKLFTPWKLALPESMTFYTSARPGRPEMGRNVGRKRKAASPSGLTIPSTGRDDLFRIGLISTTHI
jgi:hypothetical protein